MLALRFVYPEAYLLKLREQDRKKRSTRNHTTNVLQLDLRHLGVKRIRIIQQLRLVSSRQLSTIDSGIAFITFSV